MSLNLNETPPRQSSVYHTSPAYTEAVNDAQLMRTFSLVALAGSILIFIGGAVAIGVGVAVIGLGGTRYWRVLGIAVIALSVLSFVIGPFRVVASAVMAVGVVWKGVEVLGTLAGEGKGDPDWETTRKRAITGIILSSVALAVNAVWMILILLRLFVR
jgi:hypothetical protein